MTKLEIKAETTDNENAVKISAGIESKNMNAYEIVRVLALLGDESVKNMIGEKQFDELKASRKELIESLSAKLAKAVVFEVIKGIAAERFAKNDSDKAPCDEKVEKDKDKDPDNKPDGEKTVNFAGFFKANMQ